jgi:hypothetical protein
MNCLDKFGKNNKWLLVACGWNILLDSIVLCSTAYLGHRIAVEWKIGTNNLSESVKNFFLALSGFYCVRHTLNFGVQMAAIVSIFSQRVNAIKAWIFYSYLSLVLDLVLQLILSVLTIVLLPTHDRVVQITFAVLGLLLFIIIVSRAASFLIFSATFDVLNYGAKRRLS